VSPHSEPDPNFAGHCLCHAGARREPGDAPPHVEGLAAGQELRSPEKLTVGQAGKATETVDGKAGMRVHHWQAPSPRPQRSR
jgi:hypothetical protein